MKRRSRRDPEEVADEDLEEAEETVDTRDEDEALLALGLGDDLDKDEAVLEFVTLRERGKRCRIAMRESELIDQGPESAILDRVSIAEVLTRLAPSDYDLVVLAFAYRVPEGYEGQWPPRLEDIAEYLGATYPRIWRPGRLWPARVSERLTKLCATWRDARLGLKYVPMLADPAKSPKPKKRKAPSNRGRRQVFRSGAEKLRKAA